MSTSDRIPFPCEPCSCHVLEDEELVFVGETAAEPCGHFVSAGFSPLGDFEHSLFCRSCGWELADHPECLTADECEERGLDPLVMGTGPDCRSAHGERGLPHTQECWPIGHEVSA